MTSKPISILYVLGAVVLSGQLSLHAETKPESPHAQDPERYRVQRLQHPIILDGRIDEPDWESVTPLPVVMMMPIYNAPPSERTEILIAYDSDYLYIAGRFYDSEPDKIQGPSQKRDYLQGNTDWFGIVIDTFNDKENGLAFFTTPSGLRTDCTVFNDAVGELPINISWNTFWDVAASQDESGWYTEIRIPFSSLRFQDKDEEVVMGLITYRWIARKFEAIVYPPIPPNWGTWSLWKVSRAQEIVLEGVHSRKPLYITPYTLGGYGLTNELNDPETAYIRDEDAVLEAGLDLKYGISSNLTLDLTLNTDFAQVEADDLQVNLTRFSLFFPEKRLFFQERSSTFDFNIGGPYNRLFYSRRIGIYEDEDEAVRIYGGARLVGRIGSWDLGFLDMQTAPVADLSSENFGVLRLRSRVINQNSYIGGMLTSRIAADGTYNTAYGLDGIFRLFENDYLSFKWAQTFQTGFDNRPVSLDPAKFLISWERRIQRGIGMDLSISRTGKDYDPGMGFEMREDYLRFGNRILYGWNPSESSPLLNHSIFADGFVVFRNEDEVVESAEIGPGWNFSFRSGYSGEFALKLYREDLLEDFELTDDIIIPPGHYTFSGIEGRLETPMGRLVSAMFLLEAGTFFDGSRISATIWPSWAFAKDMSLSAYYQFNRVNFPERAQLFTAHILRTRLTTTFSTKLSASAFVQYNSDSENVIANFRIRYNPREGNDLYIVYNEDFNTDRNRKVPLLPFTNSRAVMIKFSYTFKFER